MMILKHSVITWALIYTIEYANSSTNLLCQTERLSAIKGNWVNNSDCSWINTDGDGYGDVLWFGDSTGLIPDSSMNNLSSFTATLSLTILNCTRQNCNAGLLFHAKNVSVENDKGYQYVYFINSETYAAQFATIFNIWDWIEYGTTIPSFSFNKTYQLKIISNGSIHSFYLNNTKVFDNYNLCELQKGSFGLRTFFAPTIFHSFTIEENFTYDDFNNQSLSDTYDISVVEDRCSARPTLMPTLVPTLVPTLAPTLIPTTTPTNAPTNVPTSVPTTMPTNMPINAPTRVPTIAPLTKIMPTRTPTNNPFQIQTSVDAYVPSGRPHVHGKPTSPVRPSSNTTNYTDNGKNSVESIGIVLIILLSVFVGLAGCLFVGIIWWIAARRNRNNRNNRNNNHVIIKIAGSESKSNRIDSIDYTDDKKTYDTINTSRRQLKSYSQRVGDKYNDIDDNKYDDYQTNINDDYKCDDDVFNSSTLGNDKRDQTLVSVKKQRDSMQSHLSAGSEGVLGTRGMHMTRKRQATDGSNYNNHGNSQRVRSDSINSKAEGVPGNLTNGNNNNNNNMNDNDNNDNNNNCNNNNNNGMGKNNDDFKNEKMASRYNYNVSNDCDILNQWMLESESNKKTKNGLAERLQDELLAQEIEMQNVIEEMNTPCDDKNKSDFS